MSPTKMYANRTLLNYSKQNIIAKPFMTITDLEKLVKAEQRQYVIKKSQSKC